MAERSYFCEVPNASDGELGTRLLPGETQAPDDDASQRHEFELERQKFERTRNIAPSKLVK